MDGRTDRQMDGRIDGRTGKALYVVASLRPKWAAMYGSLEPRDLKANSKHDNKSKHDSFLTDLLWFLWFF